MNPWWPAERWAGLAGVNSEISAPGSHPPLEPKAGAVNRAGRNAYGGHGYLPVYPAWYRRQIEIPASSRDKIVSLDFGGVYRDAIVFVNADNTRRAAPQRLRSGFRVDITSAVKFGKTNELAVFVDPRWFEGWWYEGAGIYRHVRLVTTDRLRIAPWGNSLSCSNPLPDRSHTSHPGVTMPRLGLRSKRQFATTTPQCGASRSPHA